MAQTWIFQANPDRFDLDGYLAGEPSSILWLVRQRADQMQVGDTVYLWRAIGSGDAKLSGVVAAGEILAPPTIQPDSPEAAPFWQSSEEQSPQPRVNLHLYRIALKDRLKRAWFENDPVLANAAILKLRTGTNFLLRDDEAARLNALWSRTGQDWDYAETVAGMWLYWKTKGGPLSKLPNSLVADVALRTGRVVGGVYNKAMNFRALDPTDARAGLPAASNQDRTVWSKFYDTPNGEIVGDALDAEYHRLWDTAQPPQPAADTNVEQRARALRNLTLSQLLDRYAKRALQKGTAKPRSRIATARTYERDPLVVAIALARSEGRCEVPNCAHALFSGPDGNLFVEVHHIEPLAEGGADTIENVASVCPSHHREAHHGMNAADLASALQLVRGTK